MKEIGSRYETVNGTFQAVYLVELSAYELSQVKTFLESRDLEKEATALELWGKRFAKEIAALKLPVAQEHAMRRTVGAYTRDGEFHNFTFEADAGTPLEFDEWARRIVETHDARGKPLHPGPTPFFAFRNCGKKGNEIIMAALIGYVNSHPDK